MNDAIAQAVGYARGVGNREALLAGAKQCLQQKGYARTTVRDITAAAGGVSMAAIGYHFGSREALLNAALFEAMDDWGKEVERALTAVADPGATSVEQAEAMWAAMIESFASQRPLWLASVEAFLQAERSPELREQLAAGQHEARRGMTAWVEGEPEAEVAEQQVRTVGSVQTALMSGVMLQWLLDPEHAPTAAEVVAGLRALVAGMDRGND